MKTSALGPPRYPASATSENSENGGYGLRMVERFQNAPSMCELWILSSSNSFEVGLEYVPPCACVLSLLGDIVNNWSDHQIHHSSDPFRVKTLKVVRVSDDWVIKSEILVPKLSSRRLWGHNGPRNHSTYSSEYWHRECVACQRGSPPRLLTSLREAESRWETRTSSWRSDKKAASIGHSTTSSSQRSDNNKSSYNRYSLLFYRVNQLFG